MIASRTGRLVAHAILVLAVVTTLVPLVWMFGMSFKPQDLLFANPLNPFPLSPTLSNYVEVFQETV